MKHARGRFGFLLTAIVTLGAQPLSAQSSIAEQLREQWTSSRRQMVAIAEAMPADKYSYQATPEVRSFGEILAHVAGEGLMEMEAVGGVAQPGAAERFDALKSRAEILRALSEYFDYGSTVLARMTDQQALELVPLRSRQSPRWLIVMGAIGHNKEHYGNLVTYLRLNGIVPPATA
ncbi:MAG: DinB family protein [Terriglobia bacterium]